MKIVHINHSDISGGAARAAHRLHTGLFREGIHSQMLVQRKISNELNIITTHSTKIQKVFSILKPRVNSTIQRLQNTTNPIFHSSNILPSGLHKKINKSDADVIHLHWINAEMISIKEISKINKPLLWTLHDMWAFCGAEHYDDWKNPDRYIDGYYKNNRPKNYSGLDIDRWTWNRKRKHWKNIDFNFVTPSSWLADCLSKSKLFYGHQARVIPNGLDTNVFKPIPQNTSRKILNLPFDRKIILYGAINAISNPIKGYSKLRKAKSILGKNEKIKDVCFVVFGNINKRTEQELGIVTHYLGKIHDNTTLALIYSAADVMVVPSVMEAFGQTASEAMACGTPVIAFNATGLKDIVDHKQNGFLAEPYSPKSLAKGIEWIISDNRRIKNLSSNAREKAVKKFSLECVTSEYLKMYKQIL